MRSAGFKDLHTVQQPDSGYNASGITFVKREGFSDGTCLLEINHPMMARAERPASLSLSYCVQTARGFHSP
jgi:hypothetical protein